MNEITAQTVGFIGLGNMGRLMAVRLLGAGHSLLVHDCIPANGESLCQEGAWWAENPQVIAERCDVICLSLPGPTEFREVMLGADGVVVLAQPETLCIDFTTNAPALVRQTAQALADRGAALVDAPVSGGVDGARDGTLTMLVGGDIGALERARPILDALAERVLHVGEVGAASICKILHNCAVFCTNLAMMECLSAGVKAGVDARTLVEVFQSSGIGQNLDLNVALPATLFRGQFTPRFAMHTAHKDMALALELARSVDVPMALAEHCAADMTEAIRRGWGHQDNTIFLTLQEERSHVEVRTGS